MASGLVGKLVTDVGNRSFRRFGALLIRGWVGVGRGAGWVMRRGKGWGAGG